MDIGELKPGDVLLFSGEKGSFISQAIMLLTGAPVSHAAIAYSDPSKIVEETPPAVRLSVAAERFEGRTIYVNRLEPGAESLEPVLSAATEYLNDDEPYAMSNLYLVGLLMLYKRFTPSTPVRKVMIKILKKLTAGIIDYVNQKKAPGKLPMVCSQFVYQCYEDAGSDFRLQILHPVLMMAPEAGVDCASTLDRVIRRFRSDRSEAFRSQVLRATGPGVAAVSDQSEEALMRELVDALRATDPDGAGEAEDELVPAVSQFAQAAYAATTGTKLETAAVPMTMRIGASPDALNFLKAEEAYFVTPADLLDRCSNLTRVGTIP